jgi:hypothetical protein
MGHLDRFAWAAMVLALSVPVFAQPTKVDEAKAAELKKQGDELVHASKFKDALEKYDASFALVPNPAIHYNRARALQSLEDWGGALDAFDKFTATAPAELRAKVPNLDKMIAEVRQHIATLVIKCDVPGATILVGEKSAGTVPVQPFRTAPGDVTITASAPGYITGKQEVTLMPGETATIDVPLKKAATEPVATNTKEPTPFETPPQPQPEKEKPVVVESHGSGWKTLAWVSGGVGIASLGTGLAFFGLSLSDKGNADPHCPNKVCDATGRQTINEAWTFADVSTVLVVTGAVALALSVTSFIIAPKSSAKGAEARIFIGPGAIRIGGTF